MRQVQASITLPLAPPASVASAPATGNSYTAEDGVTIYTAEDGVTNYTPES